MAGPLSTEQPVQKRGKWWPSVWRVRKLDLFQVLVALAAVFVAVWLLWDAAKGQPIAAAFTRVGGPTRVETAVEASRFWLPSPRHIVTTPATASAGVMWGAARCAVLHDAPLLFTRNQTTSPNEPSVSSDLEVTSCLAKGHAEGRALRRLKVPGSAPLLVTWDRRERRIEIAPRTELVNTVVFVAAKAGSVFPDVAVGLALAAHMAKSGYRKVSLVVVPRYLEASPKLDNELRNGRELVTGGVVLGQTGIISDDERALLRQLITSTDLPGVLGQIQNTLGLVPAFLAALVALFGLGTAAAKAPGAARELSAGVSGGVARLRDQRKKKGDGKIPQTNTNSYGGEDQLGFLANLQGETVTVWLRSGRQITGLLDGPVLGSGKQVVVELADAQIDPRRHPPQATSGLRARFLAADVELITLIHTDG